MFSIDPSMGIILLYGSYPLFSIKSVIFCLISGIVGGLMVFFDDQIGSVKKIKYFFIRFFVAFIMGGVLYGALVDYFNIEPKEYIAGLIGFLSFPLFRKVFNNLDEIVSNVLDKVFDRIGIGEKNEEDKDGNS